MKILGFLWKYKIGSILAGVVFIITLPISAAVMLYTSCGIANIVWRAFQTRLGGVGEACTSNWIALFFLLLILTTFLVLGVLIEVFVRRFFKKS